MQSRRERTWCACALVMLLSLPASAASPAAPSFAAIAAAARPAVVHIFSTRAARPRRGTQGRPGPEIPPFLGRAPTPQRQESRGTGFIIGADGTIVTNAHVVRRAVAIRVKLSSRDEYVARLVGIDPKTDIAVIRIAPRAPLPALRLGDSNRAAVGDWVVAIGNPFGLSSTVTAGIISAKGRSLGAGPYDDFIQTDASINPGNSGGPLLNGSGEVVGINSAIVSRSGGNVGIGFAIPSNLARHVIDELEAHGRVIRGWVGLSVQDLTPALAHSFGLEEPAGALVVAAERRGPAARAGIARGDVIVAYNGTPITESRQLPLLVADSPIGQRAEMQVLRDGMRRTVRVTVAVQPASSPAGD